MIVRESLFIVGLLIFGVTIRSPNLKNVEVQKKGEQVEVRLNLTGKIRSVSHAPSESPLGVLIDMPNVKYVGKEKVIPGKGDLLRVKIEAYKKTGTRVVLEFSRPAPYRFYNLGDQIKILLGGEKQNGDGHLSEVKEEKFFFYRTRAKRDPFYPLINREEEQDTLLQVGKAILVGIIGKKYGKVALLQDASGKGYVLKKGDRVSSGKVISVDDSSVTFLLNDFGITRKVLLKLPSGQP